MQRRVGSPIVRPAVAADVPHLTSLLVRAFADDPVANFMFPGPGRRQRGLTAFFGIQLRRTYLPLGSVYTTVDQGGAALWGPPGAHRSPLRELLRLAPVAPWLVGDHTHRALQLLQQVDARHPTEPHWYLATLGTAPERQGKGIGTSLLHHVLDRADEEGMPAYLESSKEQNVVLYRRVGFEVVEELHGVPGAPPLWRMWREPRVPGDR